MPVFTPEMHFKAFPPHRATFFCYLKALATIFKTIFYIRKAVYPNKKAYEPHAKAVATDGD
jgi:hypothetical protein